MPNKQALQNPFPGLRPFQSDEEHLFFGRENQTLELLQILRDNRFVGVIGTSGSGKSSLVRCGLLSELYGGSFLDAGTDWEVAVMNPGGGPFNQLSKALVNADVYDSEEDDIHLKLNATLRRSRLGLVETIRQADMPEGTNFLLVVDQFEEIFRYSEAGEEEGEAADDFIAMLLEAAKQTNVPIYVIITMRSDYIGDCSKFEGLPEEINEGEYLIPRLTREEYKSVIEGPIKVGGGKLAPRLLQRLLNDIGTESDQLPCLQHALMRTWDAWVDREDAEELDLEDYRAIGGMSKALSIHADEIFATFKKESTKDTATRMFRAITEKGDDNRGIRRPLRLQQLSNITNKSLDDVKRVIEPYRQPGVTFIMPPSNRELEANTIVDISHESLMRVWQRLRNWVEEEAQSARVYRRLVDTSSLWKNGEAGLYHDPDLQIAQSWRDQYEPNKAWADLYGGGFDVASEFLEASEEEGRREEREKELARQKELEQAQELADARAKSARNMKRFAAVVGVVAIIALGAMGFAVKAQKAAELAQNEADQARESAEIAEENVKKEFARSDNSLGNSFADSNPKLALAHFSRSLEVEPNNPNAVDRSFNILAYQSPSNSQLVDHDLKSDIFIRSRANGDGTVIATAVRGANCNISLWDPMRKDPIFEIPINNHMNLWYGCLDINKKGDLLALGFNQGNEGQLIKINEDETYEIKNYILRANIGSVKFSGDGSKLLTNSWKQKITEIWNTESGDSIFSITSSSWYPTWSPDEKSILMGRHTAKSAAIVEIESGNTKLFEHDEIIYHNAVYNNLGTKILTLGKPPLTEPLLNFYVWDVNTQKIDTILTHENKEIPNNIKKHHHEHGGSGIGLSYSAGSFTPDGQKIITIATDLNIKLWNSTNGQLLDSIKIPKLPARDQNPQFSDDGRRMILPLRDGSCYTFNFNGDYSKIPSLEDSVSLSKGYIFLKHESKLDGVTYPLPEVISAHFNDDCNLLFLGSKNGIAALFDASSGEQVDSSFLHPGEIHDITTSLDGTRFATASNLGTIKVWELGNNEPIMEIGEIDHELKIRMTKIHFTSDGNFLWIHTPNESSKLNVASGEILTVENNLTGTLAEGSLNGKNFAKINDQSIELHGSNGLIFSAACTNPITSLTFSKNSELVATGLSDGSISFWEVQSQKSKILQTGTGISIISVSISADNRYLAATSSSGKLYIFDLQSDSENEVLIIEGDMACTNATFNNDSNLVGAVFSDASKGYAQVWNVETGASITPKLSNDSPITTISFSDNGNSIIVWPDNKLYSQNIGISTKWDISISDESDNESKFSKLISRLGGLKLDDNSIAIRNNTPINIDTELKGQTISKKRSDLFLQWQLANPAKRRKSPFRENLSKTYLETLTQSNSIQLLSEAIKLNPENKIALLKRGILRMSKSSEIGDPQYVLGYSDFIRAEKINSNDDIIKCLRGMSYELMGNSKYAQNFYNQFSLLNTIDLTQLASLIDLHELTSAPSANTLTLINKAISLSKLKENEPLEKEYTIRKFKLCCLDGNYSLSTTLWGKISAWTNIPDQYDSNALLLSYLNTVESRAIELNNGGDKETAIKILTPAAVASLAQNPEQISSTITNLFDISSEEDSSFELIPPNSEWIYLDNGIDQGTEWKQPWFPTEGWSKGIAKLGYGGDGENTKLSWGPNINNKFRTYYFRHQFNVEANKKIPYLLAKVVRDDGVIVYLNGKEVIRDNMPLGEINYSTYASQTAWDSQGEEIKEHQFQINGDYLEIGSNVVAAEVHQVNNGSSDLGFQLTLTGSEQTPISFISNSLINDDSSELLKTAMGLIPINEREEKTDLVKKLITTFRFRLACESNDYAEARALWKTICAWEEWPIGINKNELANNIIDTTEKHAQNLYDKDEVEAATKILIPAAFSTLVNDNPELSSSLETLFKWAHPEIKASTLIPSDASWKYLDNGSDPGKEWKDIGFDDQKWSSGQAKLGYGNDGEQTVLTYGDDDTNKHITYYFRHKFNYNGESNPKILTADLIRDDGVIVYLNGKEIIRSNMPKGEITSSTLASGHASGENESLPIQFTINSDLLKKGENLIAAEVHQDKITSSDVGFSLSLEETEMIIERYINELLNNDLNNELLEECFNYLTFSEKSKAKDAFNYALNKDIDISNESTDIETLRMTLQILGKIRKLDDVEEISKIKIINSNETGELGFISDHNDLLHKMAVNMRATGASDESVQSIRSIIKKAPPRDPSLSKNLVDLSNYYTASLFHYSGWWGGAIHDDLRTLPDQYDQQNNTPFDLRGIIQLNSGLNNDGKTANDVGWVQKFNNFYPDSVEGIKIGSRANKIILLTGLLFGHDVEKGLEAAKIIIHYEDGSNENFSLLTKVDVFDYWVHTSDRLEQLTNLDDEKVGWIGTCAKGNGRALTKFNWINQHPDKIISHIDIVGGLSDCAPFVVGITLEK